MEESILVLVIVSTGVFFLSRMFLDVYLQKKSEKKTAIALKAMFERGVKEDEYLNTEMTSIILDDMTIISSVDEFPVDISGTQFFSEFISEKSSAIQLKFVSESLFLAARLSISKSNIFISSKDKESIIEELRENNIIK